MTEIIRFCVAEVAVVVGMVVVTQEAAVPGVVVFPGQAAVMEYATQDVEVVLA